MTKFMTKHIIIALLLYSMSITPALAFLGMGDFGVKEEKELGRKFEVLIRSQLPLIEDPEITNYIKYIVKRLSKNIPPQPFDFRPGVVLHNSLNAFAVPGGSVFVFSGLIMNFETEDELAAVLAHEIAHVTQRHIANRMERQSLISVSSLALAILGIVVGGGGEGSGALAMGALGAGQATSLNYGRADENESDHIGFQYLLKAGYNPEGMVTGFQKIRRTSMLSGSSMPTYLSTHPALGDRIIGIKARIAVLKKKIGIRKSTTKKFTRIKTLLWARYGDTATAHQIFNAKSKDCLSIMGKGMLYARENNILAAKSNFDKALVCNGNDSLITREAGIFHYRKGEAKEAISLLNKTLKSNSADFLAMFYLARLMDEQKNYKAAHRYFKAILRYIPEDREVHATFGRSLGRAGNTFEAYLHLAYSHLYSNNEKKTKKLYEKAQELAKTPNNNKRLALFRSRYTERKKIWEEGL